MLLHVIMPEIFASLHRKGYLGYTLPIRQGHVQSIAEIPPTLVLC